MWLNQLQFSNNNVVQTLVEEPESHYIIANRGDQEGQKNLNIVSRCNKKLAVTVLYHALALTKGLVPFTQLVKVRRGKLVLALPSIRFS